MIRAGIGYVERDGSLTQAGYEVFRGQERRIDTLEAADATEAANAPGAAPRYACRAWVNFNGTGVVAIRASGNVSSITDNATGDYTVNFTTAMPDANYSCQVTPGLNTALTNALTPVLQTVAAGSVRIQLANNLAAGLDDSAIVCVAIFR